jgi:hypothetical protein
MIVNSSRGGGSKDTWVLEDDDRPGAAGPGDTQLHEVVPTQMPGLRYGGDWRGQQQQQQQLRTSVGLRRGRR